MTAPARNASCRCGQIRCTLPLLGPLAVTALVGSVGALPVGLDFFRCQAWGHFHTTLSGGTRAVGECDPACTRVGALDDLAVGS